MAMTAEHIGTANPHLLPLSIAAAHLNVERRQLWRLVHTGQARAVKMGQLWFVESRDLDRLSEVLATEEQETPDRGRRQERSARKLLKLIAEEPGCTVQDLADKQEVARRTALEWLQLLDRAGLIRRERCARPNWPARCYLTEQGLEALQ